MNPLCEIKPYHPLEIRKLQYGSINGVGTPIKCHDVWIKGHFLFWNSPSQCSAVIGYGDCTREVVETENIKW